MAMCRLLLAVILVAGVNSLPYRSKSDSESATVKNIQANGYPAEAHRVTTSDGYILEVHRIPYGKGQQPSGKRPVVFLMHGLVASSDCYVHLGPEQAVAYNLADAGYDVWMGNARGNHQSRRHVKLNPDDSRDKLEFFDFSFEQIALLDLPVMIDYALEQSGQEKLYYIGHSQGGTVFFILMSEKPEYNDKIISAHLMAGVGYMKHFPTPAITAAALMTDIIYGTALSSGAIELFPPGDQSGINMGSIAKLCLGSSALSYICDAVGIDAMIADAASSTDDLEAAGASLKQLAHYGQNLRDKEFRKWSYGPVSNLVKYGSLTPPKYNLKKITADITMHYTVNDMLLGEGDVLAMAKDIPNAKVRKVARESFLHVDFVVAPDAKELVTDYIIEAIKQYDN